ncbi:4-alpha-glucanotransferase [Parabacteroides sp. PF5-5]|uniref:4-alpha-glucanotransferase n=1 Tax=unclassified Parabacteroides TaxID=2649774 RepID=UPI00247671BD|nr:MULTISPECIES: 4-alpha-glucanotransferase [unclassified Parabacteroides]MDH6304525.1 4-alpha-glucanotransferase [Parabacteroides sp. PH5-39]MDH6315323.1 4-alpha-glucanotransferase [Parabacteroides sp. PF5-13]MDH6319183.1 4-alpha-glucanotransferase [Parabacteroides sp. PH5-13]MDH6322914.1 4-alpha-glucanotransferase [Parabacteroides sp. PH5-8]MDH6326514.1 4-alpha-glucanotransferase [Parabacteroides sp. PH5-41]
MKVSFNINYYTVWGQKLYIVGSIPELGAWETAFAKEMNYTGDGNWQLQLDLPDKTKSIEYKYFLRVDDQQIFEEWERNHQAILNENSELYTFYDCWLTRPANIAFYSSAFTKSLLAHPCVPCVKEVKKGRKLMIKVSAPRVEKGQSLAVAGNQACLGNWYPEQALIMSCEHFPEWQIVIDAEEITFPLEYKFLVLDTETRDLCYWEAGDNRVLDVSFQEKRETVCYSGLYLREELPPWKTAGTVIPVFSLRSEKSFGVGDLGDLKLFIDWIKKTNQRIIQVLPVNDTTVTHTWKDSYPYSAITIYALHPMYVDLSWMGSINDKKKATFFRKKQKELNAKETVDYEAVLKYKQEYCRLFFEQEGKLLLQTKEYKTFFAENSHWLAPYAVYCYFRDKYNTTDFTLWGDDAIYNKARIDRLCKEGTDAWDEISFIFFLQYVLHTQFKAVSDYARENGVVLKGDLPIGVNRDSVEVWTEPQYFNMSGQSGAPPDDFSDIGQNWKFPTYNWGRMESDDYTWWRKRFSKLGDYFDSFRIDHILGFFRIWEIPCEYIQGLCGHFSPALPLSKDEIKQYGVLFNEARFTTPHINKEYLSELFGDLADEVENYYLAQSSSQHYVLKPFCDTQSKIEKLLGKDNDEKFMRIKNGLYTIANEVLFLRDPYKTDCFHPRILANKSYLYRELSANDRYAFDHLYWDFFYHRHNNFWKLQAFKRLTPLIASTQMLVCGEDLGMIPESVPDVMNKLQILSLEIERMPKTSNREFADLQHLPYLSVCTTSTHDMSPLRSWWKEDKDKIQRYYNDVLHRPGEAPTECTSDIARQIIENHLNAPSMLVILPLQDWFATDDTLKRKDYEAERINIPANPHHYWCYRMHITIEDLMKADGLREKVVSLIEKSGRK